MPPPLAHLGSPIYLASFCSLITCGFLTLIVSPVYTFLTTVHHYLCHSHVNICIPKPCWSGSSTRSIRKLHLETCFKVQISGSAPISRICIITNPQMIVYCVEIINLLTFSPSLMNFKLLQFTKLTIVVIYHNCIWCWSTAD